MRVCLVAEGSYPYVVGGVSSWVHMLIRQFPDVDFAIMTIAASKADSGKFKYTLPSNVTELREAYLDEDDIIKAGYRKHPMTFIEKKAFRQLIMGETTNWSAIFDYFADKNVSINDLLMGRDFLDIVTECYNEKYEKNTFVDFLWTMRSVYLPVFLVLKTQLPRADIYHSISTGYAGVLASLGKHMYKRHMILSEHGIYTREREEEIIKADWVNGSFKDIWINHFYRLSECAYTSADVVTSLFQEARDLQVEIGCPPKKTKIISNGIDVDKFANIVSSQEDGFINIGAIIRVTPVKDVKTLINAFEYAKEKVKNLRLYIMGPTDEDPDYYNECLEMVETVNQKDIIFTGRVDVLDYIGKMHMIILTSISEGQPLSLMEAMAAGKPCIATNVGDCSGILNENSKNPAGLIVPIMNVGAIVDAIVKLATNEDLRNKMGQNGLQRVKEKYTMDIFLNEYRKTYDTLYRI